MKFVFALFLAGITVFAQAQKKLQYTASIEAGLARGSSDKSSVCFFSNGASYKNLSAGIGVGIDGYGIRSIPFFFDVKKEFAQHKIKPFIDASAGINIAHPTNDEKKIYGGWWQSADYKKGFFTKASVGISMPLLHKLRLFVDAGYSYKATSVQYVVRPFIGPSSLSTDIYRFNRWFAAIGFQL